jgi:hypothetical protein
MHVICGGGYLYVRIVTMAGSHMQQRNYYTHINVSSSSNDMHVSSSSYVQQQRCYTFFYISSSTVFLYLL